MSRRGPSLKDLEALYRREFSRFLRTATAIAGSDEAGVDAVQDAFANAVRARHSFKGEVSLEAWVWRIVVNAALQERKRAGSREVELEDVFVVSSNGNAADDLGVRRWVAALPERQRLAVFLRYFADLDYRAISEALDVEVGTVSATLASAHAALRRSLQEVEK